MLIAFIIFFSCNIYSLNIFMDCNSTRNSVQGLQSVILLINDTMEVFGLVAGDPDRTTSPRVTVSHHMV